MSELGLPTEEYEGLAFTKMLTSGLVMQPDAWSDGTRSEQVFTSTHQNHFFAQTENFEESQSRSTSAPTSKVSEALISDSEDQISIGESQCDSSCTPAASNSEASASEISTSGLTFPPGLEDEILMEHVRSTDAPNSMVADDLQNPVKLVSMQQAELDDSKGFEWPVKTIPSAKAEERDAAHLQRETESHENPWLALTSPKSVHMVQSMWSNSSFPLPECEWADPMYIEVQTLSQTIGSVGSKDHATGKCKPCSFFGKGKGGSCRDGNACHFCHMCLPGERQRRKKEKARFRNLIRNQNNSKVLKMHSEMKLVH
eukprot:gnl/MRDRNA2_/MRDRNA2_95756_c0_seq1.p1 gnl/MRDRNA2_/MRDRNA2_95756_c0~~gnl/MRDRNA2_/MRDRNA2_95756_c0_seq1.p1  ORF type:complete len:344 (-),score=59.28 gnl/MRDRNA2_/MRDRNA2_95756_c0_seq1:732-1673(-)